MPSSVIDIRPITRSVRKRATLTLRASQDSTIEETSPPWIHEVNARIAHLRRLKENWDGEGAPAIDYECCMRSIVFLLNTAANETPAPQIVPTSSGGLQLEWHEADIDLEIRFSPEEPDTFFYVSSQGPELEAYVRDKYQVVSGILRSLPARNERKSLSR